ncbi:MAG: plastocyanin/azurin family copper-binding protein, partial [Pirellulales bacterium]
MKKKIALVAVVVASLSYFWPLATVVRADEKPVGSITGTISVQGVRSPENVLVYIERAPGSYPPPKEVAHMDQEKLMFVPHVLPIVKGTAVEFLNSDSLLHNVFWPKNKSYRARNLGTWGKGGKKKITFSKEGELVLLCNVHPEMEGHIVVLQNPFFALVGKEGSYKIDDVPAGKYTVKT